VQADSLSDYFVKTNAGGRFTYLWSAAQIFRQHPLLGTGFGSSGFYLYQNLPDWALSNLPEVSKQLSPASSLYPNPKNLYLRLLAENGIFGFIIFFSFLLFILAQIVDALRRDALKVAGIAGLFSWTAVLIYYFMQDSFAMAELWVNFGIILGLTSIFNHDAPQEQL
jgi:O-antigen ligase